MKFDQTPHPLVEDHYHVQELINGQEKRTQDREYHRNRIKAVEERESDIRASKVAEDLDFWCEECKEDFKFHARIQVEEDWNGDKRIAFYKAKCRSGHWCIRLVTDRHKDGFYQKSRLVARDRGRHHADILQPFETGYNMLYGKK